jgi:hypothetical protein
LPVLEQDHAPEFNEPDECITETNGVRPGLIFLEKSVAEA